MGRGGTQLFETEFDFCAFFYQHIARGNTKYLIIHFLLQWIFYDSDIFIFLYTGDPIFLLSVSYFNGRL